MRNVVGSPRFWAKNPVIPDAIIFNDWPEELQDFITQPPVTDEWYVDGGNRHYTDCNCRCTHTVFNGTQSDAGTMTGYLDSNPEQLFFLPLKIPSFCYDAVVIKAATSPLIKLSAGRIPVDWPLDAVWDEYETQAAGRRHNIFATRATKQEVKDNDTNNSTGNHWQLYYWLVDASASYDPTPSRLTGDIDFPIAGTPILLYHAHIRASKIQNPRMSLAAVEFFLANYPGCPNPPSPNPLHLIELVEVRFSDYQMMMRGPGWQNPNRSCCGNPPTEDAICCQDLAEPASDGDGLENWFPWVSGTIDGDKKDFLIGYGLLSESGFELISWPGMGTRATRTPLRADGGIISIIWPTGARGGLLPLEIGTGGAEGVWPDIEVINASLAAGYGYGATALPIITNINLIETSSGSSSSISVSVDSSGSSSSESTSSLSSKSSQSGSSSISSRSSVSTSSSSFSSNSSISTSGEVITVAFYYDWPTHCWPECDPRAIFLENKESGDIVIEKSFNDVGVFKECIDETDYDDGFFYLLDNFSMSLHSFGTIASVSVNGKSCTITLDEPINYPVDSFFEIAWDDTLADNTNHETFWFSLRWYRAKIIGGTGDGTEYYDTLTLTDHNDDDNESLSYTIDRQDNNHQYIQDDPVNVFPAALTSVMIRPLIWMPTNVSNSFIQTKRSLQSTGKLKSFWIPLKNFRVDYSLYLRNASTQIIDVDPGGGPVENLTVLDQQECSADVSVTPDRVPGLYRWYSAGSDPTSSEPREQSIYAAFWSTYGDVKIIREMTINGLYKKTPLAITPPTEGYGIDSGGPRAPSIASGTYAGLTPFQLREFKIKDVEGGYNLNRYRESPMEPKFAPDRRMRFYGTPTSGDFTLTYQRVGGAPHTTNFGYDASANDIQGWLEGLESTIEADGYPAFVIGDITIQEA